MTRHSAVTGLTTPPLVDTHGHIQDRRFNADRPSVVERAWEAGLVAIVCPGYDLASSQAAIELATRIEGVYAAVGVHPNNSGEASDADWDAIVALAAHPRVVAIGETGLDNYRDRTEPATQERWFARHLQLAAQVSRPVIVHNRDASGRITEMLEAWVAASGPSVARAVMHCFSADERTLQRCLALGFNISIAGPVTFASAADLRHVATQVPSDRLVIETDCPYLTPLPHRGQRNEPAYVAHTARFLAELRGTSFAELAQTTTHNAAALFNLPVASGAAAP